MKLCSLTLDVAPHTKVKQSKIGLMFLKEEKICY